MPHARRNQKKIPLANQIKASVGKKNAIALDQIIKLIHAVAMAGTHIICFQALGIDHNDRMIPELYRFIHSILPLLFLNFSTKKSKIQAFSLFFIKKQTKFAPFPMV